jgi:hypothetical protein
MLMSEAFPEFTTELQGLLRDEGEVEIAEQVPDFRILERCRCGDDYCATMYAYQGRRDSYQPDYRSVSLHPKTGVIVLDVIEGNIIGIEVLFRDAIRKKLLEILP